jgi:hypothetical protein
MRAGEPERVGDVEVPARRRRAWQKMAVADFCVEDAKDVAE